MFVDASAIVAILNREPGYEHLAKRIETHKGTIYVSPVVRFEASTSIARSRVGAHKTPSPEQIEVAITHVGALLDAYKAKDITITPTIGQRALQAAQKYGRHVGHPARLNLGDCFAYACATAYNCELIYVGNDFSHTDLR